MGSIQVLWDRTDGSGRPAATGLYTVRYSAGGQVRKSYPVLVNGGLTAVTDSTGHYIISNANLPIGAAPVPDYASDNVTFYGNYRIDTEVFLEFSTPRHYRLVSVSLVKDQLALVNILLD